MNSADNNANHADSNHVDSNHVDSRNLAIGILSTTAMILLVGLLIIHTRPQQVMAAGMTTTNGDYAMTVGVASQNNEEVVYIIDAPMQRLIAYTFDAGRREIGVVDAIDLAEMRASANPKQPQRKAPPKGKRGRRRP